MKTVANSGGLFGSEVLFYERNRHLRCSIVKLGKLYSQKEWSQDDLGRQYPACKNGESRWILFSSPNWAMFSQNKPENSPLPRMSQLTIQLARPEADVLDWCVGGPAWGQHASCPLRKAREDEQLPSVSPTLIQVN
uniref:Uncharacterized protein n=1 Tax=Branchiostoma floridae TaxID=7739 RepID=C3Z7Z1_BRAFL|eukprot:XP_002595293.1 hypothetical protein BRAFLDRAFT_96826 [Branchiostoma floridae]